MTLYPRKRLFFDTFTVGLQSTFFVEDVLSSGILFSELNFILKLKYHLYLYHLLLQEIFNLTLTGTESRTEFRLNSRVASYKKIARHTQMCQDMDKKTEIRGNLDKSIFFPC